MGLKMDMPLAALPSLLHKEQKESSFVTKILPALLVLLMGLHIIKPLGVPGLKRRADFWKIAVVALFVMVVAAGFHVQKT